MDPENHLVTEAPCEQPWTEADWSRFLRRVEDEKVGVIPILGPDLVRCGSGEETEPLTRYVARELARRFGLPTEIVPSANPLDSVAAMHTKSGGQRVHFTEELCDLFTTLSLPTPEPLRQLAEIGHFGIFITTAHDPLLERALTEARGVAPELLSYSPKKWDDLSTETLRRVRDGGRPVIYQLLGERSTNADFWAVSEEDRLEFYHALQAWNRYPKLLFSELRDKHLLLAGGGYPDWLARFFLRTLNGERLSTRRSVEEIIADREILADTELRTFLVRYSTQTRFYPGGDPVVFIAELHRRYIARHPRVELTETLPVAYNPPPPEAPAHAVFLSYAREDLPAVRRLYSELRAAGIPAWFDMERLEGGDAFEKKIFKAIDKARLFVPVVSRSVGIRPRFVHREWNYAAERVAYFPANVPFVVPVFIDDLLADEAPVPDCFVDVHIERLSGGATNRRFIDGIKRMLG